MRVRKSISTVAIGLALASMFLLPSLGSACVVVNGVPLTYEQIRMAGQLHGIALACGRYWLDPNTGVWGNEGGPARGIFGDGHSQQRSSGNGDGYGGQLHRGPFGDWGSDGDCSYYFDPDSGASVMTGNC